MRVASCSRVSGAKVQSLRRNLVTSSLTRAFAISLMLHFIGIAAIELGRMLGWWDRSIVYSLVKNDIFEQVVKTAEERAEMQRQMQQQQPPEAELVFVDVDPTQAATEPPKDAKYYSSHNTVAANRSQDEEKNSPKIEGKQERIPKTTDTLRPAPPAQQPSPPPEKSPSKAETLQPAPQPKTQPAPAPQPAAPLKQPQPEPLDKGETVLARVTPREERPIPQNNPPPEERPQPRQRPRSVAEARAQKGIIEGPKMRQKGGVGRIAEVEGLDVKATPFGTYDALFIEAVQSRWFSLLDERDFVGNQSGKVVVEFRLHHDGRISNLNIVSATVNEMLSWFCQRAVLDPAPYRPFPPDLRRMLNSDYREIRFTFYYNQ